MGRLSRILEPIDQLTRFRGYEFAIGFLAATAIWAVIFLIEPPKQSDPRINSGQEASRSIVSRRQDAQTADIGGVKRGEWLLFFATLGLWFATWQLVRGADQAAKRQLRAYVSVEKFIANPIRRTDTDRIDGWELSIFWKNSGTTPTRDLLTHVNVRFERDEIPDNFRFPDVWIIGRKPVYPPHFLPPNGGMQDGVVNFSVAQLNEVKAGKMTLYLYGWADYNDIFFPRTPRHRTEFCARVTLPGAPELPGMGQIAFDLHLEHNGADEECMRRPTTTVKRRRILPI